MPNNFPALCHSLNGSKCSVVVNSPISFPTPYPIWHETHWPCCWSLNMPNLILPRISLSMNHLYSPGLKHTTLNFWLSWFPTSLKFPSSYLLLRKSIPTTLSKESLHSALYFLIPIHLFSVLSFSDIMLYIYYHDSFLTALFKSVDLLPKTVPDMVGSW